MTDTNLKDRMMLWHKGLAQITGAMSLSYFGTGLSKSVIQDWARRARIIADDLDAIVSGKPSVLDETGKRVLDIVASSAPTAKRPDRGALSSPAQEADHVEATDPKTSDISDCVQSRASSRQGAGPKSIGRKATRRKADA